MILLTDLCIHDVDFVSSSQVNVDGLDVVIPSFAYFESVRADVFPVNASATLGSSGP